MAEFMVVDVPRASGQVPGQVPFFAHGQFLTLNLFVCQLAYLLLLDLHHFFLMECHLWCKVLFFKGAALLRCASHDPRYCMVSF
jgi:hypothetical protein